MRQTNLQPTPIGNEQANARWAQGFTLIELMITVALVAILASIAYPSYTSYIRRTHRSEATSTLLNIAAAQEKFFLQNNRYAGASVAELTDAPTDAPPGLGISSTTTHGHYTITLARPTTTTYTATATATGSQASDTACATMTLDQAGARTPTASNCWK